MCIFHFFSGVTRRLVPTAPDINQCRFEKLKSCLPMAAGLPIGGSGDFGTSPFFGQLTDKPLLVSDYRRGVSDAKRNRGREISVQQHDRPWKRSSSSMPALSLKFQAFGIGPAQQLKRLIKGQVDGIANHPRLRAASSDGASVVDQKRMRRKRSPTFQAPCTKRARGCGMPP